MSPDKTPKTRHQDLEQRVFFGWDQDNLYLQFPLLTLASMLEVSKLNQPLDWEEKSAALAKTNFCRDFFRGASHHGGTR